MADREPSLYGAGISDPRERAAQPRERPRGRAAPRSIATSDVTRFRGVAAALVAAGATAAIAAIAVIPQGSFRSPGALSLPHEEAKLGCASCHEGAGKDEPAAACATCHGEHRSQRRGHEALYVGRDSASAGRSIASSAMRCTTCHTIHTGDQGVRFSPGEKPIRYGPGAARELPQASFQPSSRVTVPIVTASSCERCHDTTSPHDPSARCFAAGQEALAGKRPVLCFDEHAPAFPDTIKPRSNGVCAAQHTEDRAAAWDAAREAATRLPVIRPGGALGGVWFPLLAGLGAAAITLVVTRTVRTRAARSAQAASPVEASAQPAARVKLPVIDTSRCLGCYACADACPYDVIEIERYVAVVARPDACCGLTLCEQRCPNGSLTITDGDVIGDRPRLDDRRMSADVPGLYLAGDVTGLPLIKNAINQGALTAQTIADDLAADKAKRDGAALDLLIVGAGPAGISAALRAQELGLAFEVIEQGKVAESIRSFPRGKLVFDQPLDLPIVGKLWLSESTKEELLLHWMRIVRKEKLPIREDTRMTKITRGAQDGLFYVAIERDGAPSEIAVRRVLLAIGQRGSPRKLPIDLVPEAEAKVHYHLADARSFAEKRVIVVGLGDVAMETAVAIARQPGTSVTVVHRGEGFSRGKARNVAEMKRMIDAGRITARWSSSISAIDAERATLRGPRGDERFVYDAIFVMIGSIPPVATLSAAGVKSVASA